MNSLTEQRKLLKGQYETIAAEPISGDGLKIGTYTKRDLSMLKPYIRHNTELQETNNELLEALVKLVNDAETAGLEWQLERSGARAAIAKARGL